MLHLPIRLSLGVCPKLLTQRLLFLFSSAATCPADKDPWPIKFPNYLSALSAGELVRRIALHREIPKGLRFPGAEWADMQVCFLYSKMLGVLLFYL